MAIDVRILLSLALLAVWMDPTAADGSQVDSVSEPFHGEISRGVERRDEAVALEVAKPPRTRRLTKKKALATTEEPRFIGYWSNLSKQIVDSVMGWKGDNSKNLDQKQLPNLPNQPARGLPHGRIGANRVKLSTETKHKHPPRHHQPRRGNLAYWVLEFLAAAKAAVVTE
ncbi:hypothetical protein H310_09558 [Aphanomyces invadans]|uniref:RxLR effector protein n=1 Tax=Aphanomyces invadans TaxID=157072 RepID=A0A024TVL9_9STRA|nr:hypothetical protein H310_09558 [Aphanomyces invadans]ETV97671.1 hypothetical protein H310_09558 [Aphanomyces invadans]|eukprot:XP_008873880.1 hypothetical protein H310_09558 [Aphanomyces invadans]